MVFVVGAIVPVARDSSEKSPIILHTVNPRKNITSEMDDLEVKIWAVINSI